MLSNFFTTLVPLLFLTASSNPPVLDQHTFVSGNIAQPMTNTTQLPEEDALFYYNQWGNASIKIPGVEENQIAALHPEIVSLLDSLIDEYYGALPKERDLYHKFFSDSRKLMESCTPSYGKKTVSKREAHEFYTCLVNIDPSSMKNVFKKALIDSKHWNDLDYDAVNADFKQEVRWMLLKKELLTDEQLHAIYDAITSNLEEIYSTIITVSTRDFFIENLDMLVERAVFIGKIAEALSIKEDDYHLQIASDGGLVLAGHTTSYGYSDGGDVFFIPVHKSTKMTWAVCSDVNCSSVESTTLE